MLEILKNATNTTYTENGAATKASSLSSCVDLFATIGAIRSRTDNEIISRFMNAFAENPDIATKILFYARDIRGGLGERRVFRTIIRWLCTHSANTVIKNIKHIPEYGRYDDLLALIGTNVQNEALDFIAQQLNADLEALESDGDVSLLAKWLPSVNASNADTVKNAKIIARYMGMNDAQYRKTLVKLRARIRIIENNLREMDYSFDYSAQPSKAMFKYRKAFNRNDGERYEKFLESVIKGEATIHTGTLLPYEIIRPITESISYYSRRATLSEKERASIDTTWNALENFTGDENSLVVVDGSGSMYNRNNPSPASVALSLGIYFAERNKGMFHNHFITFSENPRLVEIKGSDLTEKVNYCMQYNEVANTNIQKVFMLILDAAKNNNLPQEEMPTTIYIISDMEFDSCADDANVTNFEYAKLMYRNAGYELPNLVFWNVDSRTIQQPVTINDRGVALVSGASPRIFSMVTSGRLSPMDYMMDILSAERYSVITS